MRESASVTTCSSAGNGGGRFAPGASAEPRPLARGADGHGGRRRAARPACLSMWLLAVTRSPAPRYTDRCGWPVQRCRRFLYRSRSQSRALLRRVPTGRPLSSDLARQTHWHLSVGRSLPSAFGGICLGQVERGRARTGWLNPCQAISDPPCRICR